MNALHARQLLTLFVCALGLGACTNDDYSYLKPFLLEKVPKVIAHRGMHSDGASENSLAALRKAMEANCDGIELDVWMTADGRLVVSHDEYIGDVSIQTSTYDDIKDARLDNGEPLPTFDSFIDTFKSMMDVSESRLVVDVRPLHAPAQESEEVERLMETVRRAGVAGRVDFVSFSLDICRRIAASDPSCLVGYLRGDLAPDELLAEGIRCMNYEMKIYDDNHQWVDDMRRLHMVSGVWPINAVKDMKRSISLGMDLITTDNPAKLQEIISSALAAE